MTPEPPDDLALYEAEIAALSAPRLWPLTPDEAARLERMREIVREMRAE